MYADCLVAVTCLHLANNNTTIAGTWGSANMMRHHHMTPLDPIGSPFVLYTRAPHSARSCSSIDRARKMRPAVGEKVRPKIMIIIMIIIIVIIMIIIIIIIIIITIVGSLAWLRTSGVNTNAAAAKVMSFDRLGKRYALALVGR